MNDISIYFQPITFNSSKEGTLGEYTQFHTENFGFPELEKNSVAILYCPEYRNCTVDINVRFNDNFRNKLYQLYRPSKWNKKIYDLGNLLPGENSKDTYFALSQSVKELIKNDILPIIVGGSQDLCLAIYKAYQELEQTVNIVSIDSNFDIGSPDELVTHNAFLSQILLQKPNNLFNYSVIGVQLPYVKEEHITLFEDLFFDYIRLGEFNSNFKKSEPIIRNADFLNIDLQAIKASDFIGDNYLNPNGFTSEQICQIAKYAGISDKLTSFSLLNLFSDGLDSKASNLVAEMIWYFMDGVSDRKGDFPVGTKSKYTKFIVNLEDFSSEIVFYKSDKTERWWMEVPYSASEFSRFDRHHLVPCNLEDYEAALKNEMPDLWWKTHQKLH